jgi:hypothetical protein
MMTSFELDDRRRGQLMRRTTVNMKSTISGLRLKDCARARSMGEISAQQT